MKKRVIFIVIFIVMLLLILGKIIDYKKKEAVAAYDGKWKVTHQLTTYFRAPSNFFPHHYLGRTIILSGNSMETSFGEWPSLLEWEKVNMIILRWFLILLRMNGLQTGSFGELMSLLTWNRRDTSDIGIKCMMEAITA